MAAPITLTELAGRLGLDQSTLRHQIRNGALRATKVGPVWTVTPAEAARYEATHQGRPGPKAKRKKGGTK